MKKKEPFIKLEKPTLSTIMICSAMLGLFLLGLAIGAKYTYTMANNGAIRYVDEMMKSNKCFATNAEFEGVDYAKFRINERNESIT